MAITQEQARAMAYALCDEIETRAIGVMENYPQVKSKAQAMAIVVEAMAIETRESGNG